MLLPRMGYLHLFLAEIRDHFASFAPARNVEVWFESAGVPLKWCVFTSLGSMHAKLTLQFILWLC